MLGCLPERSTWSSAPGPRSANGWSQIHACAKITFTGSPDVGRHILSVAGIKKVTLELGNTSPVVIAPDADLDFVAKRCAVGAYYNSGQVCISVQRIYSQKQVYEPFAEKFVKATDAMIVGDPLDERVDVGPMIDLKGSGPH